MDFSYADAFGGPAAALEAYERLIHDVMIGDRTLFTTADGIERLWEISAPVLEAAAAGAPLRAGLVGARPAMNDLIAPAALAPAGPPRLGPRIRADARHSRCCSTSTGR